MRAGIRTFLLDWAFRLAAESMHDARASEGDEAHLARLPRLEPHRGAGGDVEATAPGDRAIEGERRVGLGEVVVAADLDRPVAGVRHLELEAVRAGIQLDLARGGEEFAGDHARVSGIVAPHASGQGMTGPRRVARRGGAALSGSAPGWGATSSPPGRWPSPPHSQTT